MGMYAKLFVACSFGFIILTIVAPVVSDEEALETTTEAHSSRTHHHHKGHHQHHHHHHHTNNNKKRNKKNHHHRKNRKIGHGSTKRGDHGELLHLGNSLQPNFASPETLQVEASMRPARNRREKDDATSPTNEKVSFDKTATTASTTTSTTTTTAKTTTSFSPPVYAHAVAITESGTKPVLSCSSTSDCKNITNSICAKEVCDCIDNLPVFISSVLECKGAVTLNATCDYEDQCLFAEEFSTCDQVTKRCVCIQGYEMKEYPDVGVNCVTKSGKSGGTTVDPAMIGVLAGLALMFVIICVVLRLFSKARFRENRSIFNTPNPRLMNASLFKDSKLLSPTHRGDRRGSRASMRGPPSRAPSITSVNKDGAGRSPNGSLSKGRRGSTLSTASATGSAAAAAPPNANTPSPGTEKKQPAETTVAIEAVD